MTDSNAGLKAERFDLVERSRIEAIVAMADVEWSKRNAIVAMASTARLGREALAVMADVDFAKLITIQEECKRASLDYNKMRVDLLAARVFPSPPPSVIEEARRFSELQAQFTATDFTTLTETICQLAASEAQRRSDSRALFLGHNFSRSIGEPFVQPTEENRFIGVRPPACWCPLLSALPFPDRRKTCVEVVTSQADDQQSRIRELDQSIETTTENTFYRRGGNWTTACGGIPIVVDHRQGFDFIRLAMMNPGKGIDCLHALELIRGKENLRQETPFQKLADTRMMRECRNEFEKLKRELNKAEQDNDPAQVDFVRKRMAALHDQITATQTPAQAAKGFAREKDKARQSVRKAIRRALQYLEDANPEVHSHLQLYFKFKPLLIYAPPPHTRWDL